MTQVLQNNYAVCFNRRINILTVAKPDEIPDGFLVMVKNVTKPQGHVLADMAFERFPNLNKVSTIIPSIQEVKSFFDEHNIQESIG